MVVETQDVTHRKGCGCSRCRPLGLVIRQRCKCGHAAEHHESGGGACAERIDDGDDVDDCGCRKYRPETIL